MIEMELACRPIRKYSNVKCDVAFQNLFSTQIDSVLEIDQPQGPKLKWKSMKFIVMIDT